MATVVTSRHILMLTWEYPPAIVGGLGRHVGALAKHLVALGHRVTVVTRANREANAPPATTTRDGVRVVRVADDPSQVPFDDLVPWVLAFNHRLLHSAGSLLRSEHFDVVHAHDWLVAHAAVTVADVWDLPLVATIHATEHGRHQGHLPGATQRTIDRIERWLAQRADTVITCSQYMRRQVEELFDVGDKIVVVANGVAVEDFDVSPQAAAAYRRALTGPRTKMVLFAGRLEYEKGVQTLLDALASVRSRVGPTVCYVAGIGSYSATLRARVADLGLQRHVRFTGFLADEDLRSHYAAADVAVTPSIYEPFGLVAVEAMACGTPVVVSATGGLSEIAAEGAGLLVPPNDPVALADRLVAVLTDQQLAQRLVAEGRRRIAERYDWSLVARRTAQVLDTTIGRYRSSANPAAAGGSVGWDRATVG